MLVLLLNKDIKMKGFRQKCKGQVQDRSGSAIKMRNCNEQKIATHSPRNKCGAGPAKVDYCIRLTAPQIKTPSHHHRLFYQQ